MSLLGVLALLSGFLVVFPAPQAVAVSSREVISFTDVDEDSSFATEISWLANAGVSSGWVSGGGREYRPFVSITRDAMAAFLYRLAGVEGYSPPAVSPFVDVTSASSEFYTQIAWLADQGVSTGWVTAGGREFRPYEPITRDAMAAFLYRLADVQGYSPPAVSPFVDVTSESSVFYPQIAWFADQGISTGWDVGSGFEYRPFNTVTRDAMAAFLYRYSATTAPVDDTNPEEGEVTVAPNTDILDNPETLAEVQVEGDEVRVPAGSEVVTAPNTVLVAGVSEQTPEGLLVRVVSETVNSDGSRIAVTVPATVQDAIVSTDGQITVTGETVTETVTPTDGVTTAEPDPEPAALAPLGGGSTGNTRSAGLRAAPALTALELTQDLFRTTLKWEKTLEGEFSGTRTLGDGTELELSGSGKITSTLTSTVAMASRLTLDIGFLSVNEVELVFIPEAKTVAKLGIDGALHGHVSKELASLHQTVTFAIGPVPVVVTAEENLIATIGADGTASIEVEKTARVHSEHGFRYDHGNMTVINTDPILDTPDATIKATATLTTHIGVDFGVDIRLYGAAGIIFGIEPFVEAEITVTATGTTGGIDDLSWTCPVTIGVTGRIGLVAGIKIFGINLTPDTTTTRTHTWDLYTHDYCTGTPPTPPTTTPTPQPTGTPTPEAADFSVSGAVILPAGSPADWYRGAWVYMNRPNGSVAAARYVDAETGAYQFDGITPGDYVVRVVRLAYTDEVSGDQICPNFAVPMDDSISRPITLSTRNLVGIDISVQRGNTITGQVTAPRGYSLSRIRGLTVDVYRAEYQSAGGCPTEFDAETGEYSVHGLPKGTYRVKFTMPIDYDPSVGYIYSGLRDEWYGEAATYEEAKPVFLQSDVNGINIALDYAAG